MKTSIFLPVGEFRESAEPRRARVVLRQPLNDWVRVAREDQCHPSMYGIIKMTEQFLEINAFLEDNKHFEPLHIKIYAPTQTQHQPDYSCLVHAPLLLGSDKKIYGIDEDQAKSLAVGFVKSLLEGKKVVDNNGEPVNF